MKTLNLSLLGPKQYSIVAYTVQLGLGFLSFLIVLRKCSVELLGWWVLYMSLISIADQARNGLIQNGMIRLLKKHPRQLAQIYGSALSLTWMASLCLALILMSIFWFYGIVAYLGEGSFLLLLLLFINSFFLQAYCKLRESILMSRLAFGRLVISKLSFGLSFVIGILVLPSLSMLNLAFLQLLAWLVNTILFWVFPIGQAQWNKKLFLDLWRFGRFTMGTNLGSMIYNKMDVLLLGSLMGPMAVAIYNVATRLTNIVEIPLSSIAQYLYPQFAKSAIQQNTKQLSQQYEYGLQLVIVVMTPLCLGLFFFADFIVELVAGAAYQESAIILKILAIVVWLKPWGRFLGITLDAINKPDWNFYFLLCWTIVNAILNLLFIPFWGVLGVAFATLLSLFMSTLIGQYWLSTMLPVGHIRILLNAWPTYFKQMKTRKIWI